MSPIALEKRAHAELTNSVEFLSANGKPLTNETYSKDDIIFNIGAELFAEDYTKIVFTILNSVRVNYFFNMHFAITANVLNIRSQV